MKRILNRAPGPLYHFTAIIIKPVKIGIPNGSTGWRNISKRAEQIIREKQLGTPGGN
jgi:hypothetical protein